MSVELRVLIVQKGPGAWWVDGEMRPATVEDVSVWLREQGAIDYEEGARITRELIDLLPVTCEVSRDATLWTLNIIDAALRVEGQEG